MAIEKQFKKIYIYCILLFRIVFKNTNNKHLF